MNIFQELVNKANELDRKGQEYLDKLPFIKSEDIAERIHQIGLEIYRKNNEDLDKCPDWIMDLFDGCVPYYGVPRNGSLAFMMGYSPAAQDALLRNFLEVLEGRETELLDFKCIAKFEDE